MLQELQEGVALTPLIEEVGEAVEEGAAAMGRSVDQLPLETLEALWVEAKRS